MDNTVYIVHAIDTEGPLYESLTATFERLEDIFGIQLPPSYENLRRLRHREIPLEGKEDAVALLLDPALINYNDTWDKIDNMLSTILSREYRCRNVDSYGGGWVYNWFCVDHIGYEVNPRRRDMGYHNIYDRYVEFLDQYDAFMDSIHWHFHPMSTYKEAHRCATSYENSPHLHQILCRRILERHFFPSVFRAGFQAERPDSHWFLEQWIPFDGTNMAIENPEEFELHNDFKKGRSGDWRRAPADWSIYHPDFYDYQKPGGCKRYIARFLNGNTRIANITQYEVDKAFARAAEGLPTLMGIASHDFRDLKIEVDLVIEFISKAAEKFPKVTFKYAEAKEAFNAALHQENSEKLALDVNLYKENDVYQLDVKTLSSEVFGPQPYLAIKTKSGRFIHDNFDFGLDRKSWHYVFHYDTVLSEDIEMIGVAANNMYGDTFIKKIRT